MRDRIWIFAGLALFVGVATLPFWSAHGRTAGIAGVPNLQLPVRARECVAPVEYMRQSHMQLLLRWRRDVVRLDERRYVAPGGTVYQRSLTGTCLGCHNKEQFCDRCHAYAGVSGPYCWNCHNQPATRVAGASWQAEPELSAVQQAAGSAARFLNQPGNEQLSPFHGSRP